MDLIVQLIPKEPYGSSKEKSIILLMLQENPAIEVPPIKFSLGDQPLKINDCDLVMEILNPIIQPEYQHQLQRLLIHF